MVSQAERHLDSADLIAETDTSAAYQLVYDAARKALAAILLNQGLRTTSSGGHIAVGQAVQAQLHPPLGPKLKAFDRMRRTRNDAEYSTLGATPLTPDDVRRDSQLAREIIAVARQVIPEMPVY